MKIVFLSPLPPPAGGIASWTQKILKSDIAKENEIYVVNTAVAGKRTQQLAKRRFVGEIKRNIRIYSDLKRALKNINPDIVHVNISCSNLGLIRDFYLVRLAKSSAKVLLHCRCDVSYQVNSRIGKDYYSKIINIADRIVLLNTPSKEFTEMAGRHDSIVLPNFIYEKNIPKINQHDRTSEKINNIIYVGHVTRAKGSDLILKIAESFPDIKFSLYGYISDEIALLPKKENVLLKGEVAFKKIMEELISSDLFIFPTLSEGFPNALLEAMACGLPCIATNVGAIPEMLENEGGILVKPGQTDDLIDAIESLNRNREKRIKMSIWNREKVLRCYTEKKVLEKLLKIYEDML